MTGNVQPPNPGDAHDLRNLLEAVLEAVTLPYDLAEHARRMETRADWVRATVKGALADDPADIGWNADFLRSRLRTEETEAAERAARASVDRTFPWITDAPRTHDDQRSRDEVSARGERQ